jgi:outer membrane protein
MKHLARAAVIGTLSLATTGAFAQQAGDWLANIGWAYVAPGAKLDSISSTEPYANYALLGASVRVGDEKTLQFGATYMLTDNVGTELSLGIPPKLNLDLTVPSGAHPKAMSTSALMPVLSVKYVFGQPLNSQLRPFLGLGISYVRFIDNSFNASDAIVGALAGQSISIKSTWAPVYTMGATYKLNENWYLNGSANYLPIKTDATLAGPGVGAGATTTSASLKMDTTIYLLSLSYKF